MQSHEYRALPAPRRGIKLRGVKGEEARFAAAVEAEMNRMARDGWEFVRSDTLPCDERQGWFGGRTTVFRTLLVFRRARAEAAAAPDLVAVHPGLATPGLATSGLPAPGFAAQGPRPQPAPSPAPPRPTPDPSPGEPPLPGPGDPPIGARRLGPATSPLNPIEAVTGARGRREPRLVGE